MLDLQHSECSRRSNNQSLAGKQNFLILFLGTFAASLGHRHRLSKTPWMLTEPPFQEVKQKHNFITLKQTDWRRKRRGGGGGRCQERGERGSLR